MKIITLIALLCLSSCATGTIMTREDADIIRNQNFHYGQQIHLTPQKIEEDAKDCKNYYVFKNWLTGIGGLLTVGGASTSIGGAIASINKDSAVQSRFAIAGSSITLTGGALTVLGLINQLKFSEEGCVVTPDSPKIK